MSNLIWCLLSHVAVTVNLIEGSGSDFSGLLHLMPEGSNTVFLLKRWLLFKRLTRCSSPTFPLLEMYSSPPISKWTSSQTWSTVFLPDNQEKVHSNILCQSHFHWKTDGGVNSGKLQKEKKLDSSSLIGLFSPPSRSSNQCDSLAYSYTTAQ